jgi:hypothetical protein
VAVGNSVAGGITVVVADQSCAFIEERWPFVLLFLMQTLDAFMKDSMLWSAAAAAAAAAAACLPCCSLARLGWSPSVSGACTGKAHFRPLLTMTLTVFTPCVNALTLTCGTL